MQSQQLQKKRKPQRDLPIGIIGSLLICTVLYMIVSFVLTGMVPYTQLDVSDPVAFALHFVGEDTIAGLLAVESDDWNDNRSLSRYVWTSSRFVCDEP